MGFDLNINGDSLMEVVMTWLGGVGEKIEFSEEGFDLIISFFPSGGFVGNMLSSCIMINCGCISLVHCSLHASNFYFFFFFFHQLACICVDLK